MQTNPFGFMFFRGSVSYCLQLSLFMAFNLLSFQCQGEQKLLGISAALTSDQVVTLMVDVGVFVTDS